MTRGISDRLKIPEPLETKFEDALIRIVQDAGMHQFIERVPEYLQGAICGLASLGTVVNIIKLQSGEEPIALEDVIRVAVEANRFTLPYATIVADIHGESLEIPLAFRGKLESREDFVRRCRILAREDFDSATSLSSIIYHEPEKVGASSRFTAFTKSTGTYHTAVASLLGDLGVEASVEVVGGPKVPPDAALYRGLAQGLEVRGYPVDSLSTFALVSINPSAGDLEYYKRSGAPVLQHPEAHETTTHIVVLLGVDLEEEVAYLFDPAAPEGIFLQQIPLYRFFMVYNNLHTIIKTQE